MRWQQAVKSHEAASSHAAYDLLMSDIRLSYSPDPQEWEAVMALRLTFAFLLLTGILLGLV
jgi:hypothetical protein